MDTALRDALAEHLGSAVARWQSVAGGDINRAFRVELTDGSRHFVKTHGTPPPGMFSAEAAGLRWLQVPSGPRVPSVTAADDGDSAAGRPALLVLEWIERGGPSADHDARLGRELATLHRSHPPAFGLERDNYIAVLSQPNDPRDDWPTFYAQRRLLPQLDHARAHGRVSPRMERGFERLLANLADRCGPGEPPARLHGDLWSGNAMTDSAGAPVLIDPAAYGGNREMDLAMMRLFGGFSQRVFDSYHEAYPLADGHTERVGLYQLYPLMVHVNLFGGGYGRRVEGILTQLTQV